MKMKNVVIVAGLGLVGLYAAKKLIDRRNRKANEANDVVEENVNEEINEEVEQLVEDPEEYERRKVAAIPVEERICPDYIYEEFLGKELNDKIKAGAFAGAVEFKRPKLRKIIWIGLYVLNIAFDDWNNVKFMIGIDLMGLIYRLIAKLVIKNENK